MLSSNRENRENASKASHGGRRYSAKASEASYNSKYKERAQQYYNNLGKNQTHDFRENNCHASKIKQKSDRKEGFLDRLMNSENLNKDDGK